jgi:LmbE family N-acetylglucosaminyl deacetylase
MSVLVCFHAHPDDEVFTTGGVMRMAADAGHRVVLVTATDGALGEVPDGLLAEGETLVERRRAELQTSADALGVHRVVLLGHPDSGMVGTPDNTRADAFCNVDVEVAAAQLAQVLEQEQADVLTVYDPHGNYGHPDHVQVHAVGVRAAELAGVHAVYEATTDRDQMRELVTANPTWVEEGASTPDVETFGLPAEEITTRVDVTTVMAAKRAAMAAHATQVGDFGPFLSMAPEQLAAAFGSEVFRRRGPRPEHLETALPLQP